MQFIDYPTEYLNLEYSLTCGQAFRWKLDDEGFWCAPVRGKLIRIKESEGGFLWKTYPGEPDLALVSDYFGLDRKIEAIYAELSASDDHLADVIDRFKGLVILRQDPIEALLSYICSTANSVPRISKAIRTLSAEYGNLITKVADIDYYAFPSVDTFAAADPAELTSVSGIGWRGANVGLVARQVLERPSGWLDGLTDEPYEVAKAQLMSIRGVGPKIADCICLFALGKDHAVPVDTHIRQVAVRYFMPELATKTITAAAYDRIVHAFWEKYGRFAGWAQEFLFYEDLLRSRSK